MNKELEMYNEIRKGVKLAFMLFFEGKGGIIMNEEIVLSIKSGIDSYVKEICKCAPIQNEHTLEIISKALTDADEKMKLIGYFRDFTDAERKEILKNELANIIHTFYLGEDYLVGSANEL